MKQSKTTLKELTARYRAVLLKCALINAMMIIGIGAANAKTISEGVYNEDDFSMPQMEDLTITGGTFNNADIYSGGVWNLTVAGGTFNGETNLKGKVVTLSGGNLENITSLDMEGNDIVIDSDNAKIKLSPSKTHDFVAFNLFNVTGDTGLNVFNATLSSPAVSGKIIGNNQTFIGAFQNGIDHWSLPQGTLNVVWNVSPSDASFTDAELILNGNSVAGAGMTKWNISSNGNDGSIAITGVQNKLTQAEIDESVNIVMNEVRKIDGSSKNIDDFSMGIIDALEADFDGSQEIQSYLQSVWSGSGSVDLEQVEAALRKAYEDHNSALDSYSVNVAFQDSSVVMNDTGAVVNNSLAEGKGNITFNNSTITAKGNNALSAAQGQINLGDNSKLIVEQGASLSLASKDNNTVNLAANTFLELSGTLNGNVNAQSGSSVSFNHSASRINGELSGTGVNLTFNDNYLFSDINNKATLNTVKIAEGKTLNIGTGTLTATNLTGGTISAVLTDAAKNTAIISGNATDVTLALDMSNASRDEVTLYKITNGTGFTFADYATNRYAVSGTSFDLADASSIGALSGWNGGDLYILRLATAGEAAVEDLEKAGVLVSLAEQNAIKVLDLAQSVLSKLDAAKQEAIAKVNDLLDQAAGKAQETKQILREIAPDTSSSGTKTALNTAKSVINVIGTRLGGGTSGNMRGRSGGDYSVGQSSVWAQGMYNYAKLDTANGFKSDSTGFAAGIETNLTDSFKTGIGYAFTKTDIDSDRSQTDVDTHTGFIYAEYKPNKFYVNAIASYGHSEYDDTTNLIGLTSDYEADTIGAQIATGYNFGILTPEAALRYTHVKQDDHTDALGATIQSKSFDTWTAVGGVKLSKKYVLKSNQRIGITPELKLAATYDFERDDETNTVVLADGSSYIVEGDMMKRFGVEAGANVGVTIGNDSEITLSYEGKFKKDYQDHTGLINFKYNF